MKNLNTLYKVWTTQKTQEHICIVLKKTKEHINNVYELPSIKQSVQYLHALASHPPEVSWLKAIDKGNYNSWPTINTKNTQKYCPESEETKLGHMRGQCQGVRSTRKQLPYVDDTPVVSMHVDKKQESMSMCTHLTRTTG
jgi:hypothetical protein